MASRDDVGHLFVETFVGSGVLGKARRSLRLRPRNVLAGTFLLQFWEDAGPATHAASVLALRERDYRRFIHECHEMAQSTGLKGQKAIYLATFLPGPTLRDRSDSKK
jgi:hypothetical protein